uniref:Uncharacterized protein n=1 Tax=Physcomitrium patens TaxID=3218 RepID=A0A2K1IHZ0_PHYPA|nr:hypothetical protein PHYPA_027586 [Physcomitrium patens]
MASSYRSLLATVKTELVEAKRASQHRIELFHALETFLPDFQAFLELSGPTAKDRAQVVNSQPTSLGNQDVQLVLMLSDAFKLNEVYCASLVASAHEKCNLHGCGRHEMMQILAGLWFTERDSLISSLQLLLHAVALDKELDPVFVAKVRVYIEKFLDAGIRTRIIRLIKGLNEDSTRIKDRGSETYIKDSTGALVERCAAIQKSRLSLCHCLYLSCFITPLNAQEVKDLYNLLKVCSNDGSLPHDVLKLQIAYTIMFSLTNALVSGAEGPEQTSVMLALDVNFCQEFQHLILDVSELKPLTEGFLEVIRLAWVTSRMIAKQATEVTKIGVYIEDDGVLYQCLNRAYDHDVFGFLSTQVFGTAAFQNDERASAFKYSTSLCKIIMALLSHPAGRQKIMDLKYASMRSLDMRTSHVNDPSQINKGQIHALQLQAQPLVSFLHFAREVFQRESELIIDNEDLWSFVQFAGGHTSYFTVVAFLDMLASLAECKGGARKVYDLLQKGTICNLGWQILFTSLVVYEQQLRSHVETSKGFFLPFSEGDARVLEAYLKVLKKVIENGDAMERMHWFGDVEPLFKMLPWQNVPPFLKGALRDAIAAFACVSSVMMQKVYGLLQEYDLPISITPFPTDRCGHHSPKQFLDMAYELNEVEAKQKEYLSIISYLKLRNVLTAHEFETRGGTCFDFFQFVRDQVFGRYGHRLYANPAEKWELVVAALHYFKILMSIYEPSNKHVRKDVDVGLSLDQSLPRMSTTPSAAEHTSANPVMELMKDLKNGEVIYANLMGILMLGVNSLSEQRASQLCGRILEDAISLSFQIFIHAFLKESQLGEACYPSLQQPLHETISQDPHQVVTLLEYVRYDKSKSIQRQSLKVMELLSAQVPTLVSVLQETKASLNIIEGYAACLDARILEAHPPENPDEDVGSLILRLLLVNLPRPSPNLTHLLLGFDVNQPMEKTTVQPNYHYSCLTVILHILDNLARPEVNARLHELCFQLLYELCVDSITCGPMVDLLRHGKYDFLPKTSRTSHDTCMERGNSSISGTDLCSSEAQDMDLQVCDFEPVAGSTPGTSSNSKPEVGFFNPAPLATRCTTKENGGPSAAGMAALRSSWIQRLFPGMMNEGARPFQSNVREQLVPPVYESTEPLLIEDVSKSFEEFGSSPELVGASRYQGRESFYDAVRSGKPEGGSHKEFQYERSNSSQPPPAAICRKGPVPAREGCRAAQGVENEYLCAEVGLMQDSVFPCENSTRVIDEPACVRLPLDSPRQQDLMLQNRMDCDAKVPPPNLKRYEETTIFQNMGRPLELKIQNESNLQISEAGDFPTEHEALKKNQVDTDRRSMPEEHYLIQSHLLVTNNVARRSQHHERNRYPLSGRTTCNKTAGQPGSLSTRLRMSGLPPADPTNEGYSEYSLGSRALGREEPREDIEHMDENVGYQLEHNINKGKNVDSSPLSPLPLFAPFKHSEKRRDAEFEGRSKMVLSLSGETLLTPLFPLGDYENDKINKQSGPDVHKDKFGSTIFSHYKPFFSHDNHPGVRGSETPLTLTPIFAPFKPKQDQNFSPSSLSKTEFLPVNLTGQDGANAVVQRTKVKVDVVSDLNLRQADHREQSGNQFTAHERVPSVYSSPPWAGVANRRDTAVFSTNFGPRFNGDEHRGVSPNICGSTFKEGKYTVNTSANELRSKKPSLEEERTDHGESSQIKKDLYVTESHNVQTSVSQGMRELFQFDNDLQQQLNTETKAMSQLKPWSNLVSEASSGSSPVLGDAVSCGIQRICLPSQSSEKLLTSTDSTMLVPPPKYLSKERHQQVKVDLEATSSSRVQGGNVLNEASALVKDVEEENSLFRKQTFGSTARLCDDAQRPDVSPRGKSFANKEAHGFSEEKNLCHQSGHAKCSDAQGVRQERSSKKRSHEARTGESNFASQNFESLHGAGPQIESGVEEDSRTTPRPQPWLQSTPHGNRLDATGVDKQEQHMSSAGEGSSQWAGSDFDHYHRRSNPLRQGFYQLPSAAAMALVGAASKRAVPLPPQRSVGTRIAVWPAIAGMQLRRTKSGTREVSAPQVEVEVVVEEG